MNKKIVLGMLLLIFSTSTINLPASWTEKFAPIKQKVKNSIKKVTLKDALDYTFKAAAVVIGVAWIVEWRRSRKVHESQTAPFEVLNEVIPTEMNNMRQAIKTASKKLKTRIINMERQLNTNELLLDTLGKAVNKLVTSPKQK